MKQSILFSKTRRSEPKDEVAKNAQLLIRAGYIHKEMAGVYSFLPLGLRVVNKIIDVIRNEMDAIGGQEVLLSTLQDSDLWKKTGRWDDEKVTSWFKTELRKSKTLVGLGFTHEEPLANIMRDHIRSFRDLPVFIYQFQNKFRNEERAKSGILRGREFIMKDLYSFCRDSVEHEDFYTKVKEAYREIFKKTGIGDRTFLTYAAGGSFSRYSHEFQTIIPAGEDIIYLCEHCKIAVNDEIVSDQNNCPLCKNPKLKKEKAVEVGNIFSLGTRFSEALGLYYTDVKGAQKAAVMGSYGIGIGRLMGSVAEIKSDDKGIIWPELIAPFRVHLIEIAGVNETVTRYAQSLYQNLTEKGIDVLYDDRDVSAGEKFADGDLIGIPYRLIISERSIESGKVEFKRRDGGKVEMLDEKNVISGKFVD